MENKDNCGDSAPAAGALWNEVEAITLWVAAATFLTYKAEYGSVLLRAFLADALAKALPRTSMEERKASFNSLVSQGLIRTWVTRGPRGADAVVFALNEDDEEVQQLIRDLSNDGNAS